MTKRVKTPAFVAAIRSVSGMALVFLVSAALSMPTFALAQNSEPADASKAQGFPNWSQFPTPPKDVPTPADIKVEVREVQSVGTQLERTANAIIWELNQPDAFAAAAYSRINPVLGAPVAQGVRAEDIEAFAQALRRKAEPPPVAK